MTIFTRCLLLSLCGLSVAGCSARSGNSNQPASKVGMGHLVAPGLGEDLRLAPGDGHAAFIREPVKPKAQGVPPSLVLGQLVVSPLGGGAARTVGTGVSNAPGGFQFSPDGRWILFLQGFNPATRSGALQVADLRDLTQAPVELGPLVSYVTVSLDSKWVAFVDGGVLKLTALGQKDARALAGEVSTAEFLSQGKGLVFRRTSASGGALMLQSLNDAHAAAVKLGERSQDFQVSPDGSLVAFTLQSAASRDVDDLFVARTDKPAPQKVASGTDLFGFSPDGKWLARSEGVRPDHKGDLVVGPASGGKGRKVGDRVERFQFSPTSSAILSFEKHNDQPRMGNISVTQLPDGKTIPVSARANSYLWTQDGKALAFNMDVYQPLPSVDLYLYRLGEPKATRVEAGVFGFGFLDKNHWLLYRTACTNGEGVKVMPRACELRRLDLAKPEEKAKTLVSGIYSFRPSEDGARLLLTTVRTDSDAFDASELNVVTGRRKTLDEFTVIPPLFASPDGSRSVYLISRQGRAGLYVADQGV